MAKDEDHRRVYWISDELLTRLRSFQKRSGFKHEAEAVRVLLNEALQLRDTASDILGRLDACFQSERNLRTLAQRMLAGHPLVTNLEIDDHQVVFTLRNGERGSINNGGELAHSSGPETLTFYSPPRR